MRPLFRSWGGTGHIRAHLFGLALFAIALAVRFALAPVLPPAGFPFLTFFPAVLLATYFGGLGPGLVVAGLSTASAWFFFIPVVDSFALAGTAELIALVFFVFIILIDVGVVHLMTAALDRLEDEKAHSAELARALHALNATLEERVRSEVAAREAAQARLTQEQRLSALGQLAGGISHDFNNIMQAVQSGASLIGRRAENAEAVRHLARMVEDAAQRGASVTRRLLSFARRGELRAEPVEPASLLAGLQEVLSHTLGPNITVEILPAPHLPTLLVDRGQLETVLVNLATNARDAMPMGGVLTIVAASQTLPADGPAPLGLDPGPYVRLTVTDTGEGMPPEVLARAGEPFFSTKAVGSGTGLGLAMARGFAEQSAGALAISSAAGAGTVVTIWLPVPATTGTATAAPPKAAAHVPARRALLVDDDDLVREFLAQGLRDHGFCVLRARDAEGALALLAAGERVDLLVTDYAMPGRDGLSLVEAVEERWPAMAIPMIVLTGNVDLDLEARMAERAAAQPRLRLLRKPIAVETLANEVSMLLEQAET